MKKEQYHVSGMTCSACSARLEKGVSKLEGMEGVSVNLLKNTMTVTYDEVLLHGPDIVKKVEEIGYGAALAGGKESSSAPKQDGGEEEAVRLRRRFLISLIFTVPLFYLAMGEMLGWPLPGVFLGMEHVMVFAFTQFLLVLPVIIAGYRYFVNGFRNLMHRAPNMDSLIAIGSGAAFLYGVYAIYRIAWAIGLGDMETGHHFSMHLYFESAAMILTLITLGKFFEARAKGRTSEAIRALMDLSPKTATVLRDEEELTLPLEDVVKGDLLLVRAGDAVPVDGVVTQGTAAVDESAITGESIPTEKEVGDKVIGGTVSKNGYIQMRATAVGEETTLSSIIRLVDDATSSKAPIAKLADQISGVFVPVVILIAIAAALVWYLLGSGVTFSMTVAISVLVISCPCALGLATPTAIMVGTGRGAAKGILIKSAESLEVAHSIDTVVLDKTGTVTEGHPKVTDIIPFGASKEELLRVAAALEQPSGHPLSEPILEAAGRAGIEPEGVRDFALVPGQGVSATFEGVTCYAGNGKLMAAVGVKTGEQKALVETLADEGKTPLFFARGGMLLGIIAAADPVKKSSPPAIKALQDMGIEVLMLTGDNEKTAQAIRREVGLSQVIAEVLPEEKEETIRALQEAGRKVAMVGDGINDAPALARADVGIAIGAGTDVAIESADIVLMKSTLMDVPSAIGLSRAVMRNIKQNLFWAFIYNAVGIPVAAGALYASFGILLSPMIAAAAMSFSSVSVVLNALRLRFFTPKWAIEDEKPMNEKEMTKMEKIIQIEGMSCKHCVAAVEKALGGVSGVSQVSVSLEEKKATLSLNEQGPSDAKLKETVESAGYEVTGIQ